jgi:hypothetical protein
VELSKSASAKDIRIDGLMGGAMRWRMFLGNSNAESATRKGSDFYIIGYSNAGDTPINELMIDRETHEFVVGGPLVTGRIRPVVSTTSTTEPAQDLLLDGNGQLSVCQGTNGACTGGVRAGAGIMGKAGGYQGNYDNVWHNLYYSGGFEYVYVNATLMGAITWQSDYRIKRNIQPLGSMWDRIKALKPVRYQHRKYREFVKDEPDERWGMLAHEVQEALLPTAAIGNKDEENVIQSINPLVMIAVLTKALQEAMTRIEALEARA